ncbi:DinB family protein [Pseudofulvibacter geojedonensis]|uniref:DinB family protein n=1 Tax=Pseudofulvibacter geojedonensis TaxID=1123758 RepID=A0ABW3I2X7_9FLAO
MKVKDLKETEYNVYYDRYISKVPADIDLREGFELDKKKVINFFSSIPTDRLLYRYKDNKWSIKEVFQHLIDTERIFMYRCFRIARKDKTALAGFNQDDYIAPSKADYKTINELLSEFTITRDYSINLLNSLSDEDLKCIGESNGSEISARAAAITLLGHSLWHIEVIEERYL